MASMRDLPTIRCMLASVSAGADSASHNLKLATSQSIVADISQGEFAFGAFCSPSQAHVSLQFTSVSPACSKHRRRLGGAQDCIDVEACICPW
eukprot:172302-Pelagomonas_calceolata.AAC.1